MSHRAPSRPPRRANCPPHQPQILRHRHDLARALFDASYLGTAAIRDSVREGAMHRTNILLGQNAYSVEYRKSLCPGSVALGPREFGTGAMPIWLRTYMFTYGSYTRIHHTHTPYTQSHAFAHTQRPMHTSYTGVVLARLSGTDGTDWPRLERRFDHAVCWLIILDTAVWNSG